MFPWRSWRSTVDADERQPDPYYRHRTALRSTGHRVQGAPEDQYAPQPGGSVIRAVSPALTEDREVTNDIEAVAECILDKSIVEATEHDPLLSLSARD